MSTSRIDRRVTRTRRQLKDALMALILEKGYDAVKIEEITERADLGRTTFYLHYRDKEELLLESMGSIVEELRTRVDEQLPSGGEIPLSNPQSESPIIMIFKHAEENANLYRIILQGEGAGRVARRMREIVRQAAYEFFSKRLPNTPEGQSLQKKSESGYSSLDVITGYFSSALLGFIAWWLEQGMPYPPEQVAGMFSDLFFRGATHALGWNRD